MAMTTTETKPTSYRPAIFPSVLYALGMVAVFLGERALEVGRPRTVATVVGVLLVLAAVASRAVRQSTVPVQYRSPERSLLALYVLGVVALALYFLNSDLMFHLSGKSLEQRVPRVSAAIGALWPAVWLCSALPVVFVELSLWTMAKAPLLELGRVRTALLSGLGIGFALVFCFAITYVASERDVRADFSYFRTARPGDSTKKIVQALDKPVQVHLFFPPANEVREEVEGYFADLARESKLLEVQRWDHALHPAKARELGVTGNGIIVVARDALKEQIGIPLNIDSARTQLKGLDQDVHKRLLGVTRKQKVAYFTVGHEERTAEPVSETDRRGTVKTLKSVLVDQGFEPRDLGVGQGLATEVPADASVVLILGPRQPFMKEEVAALVRYLDKNGRLLIALDPDAGQSLPELLGPLSLKYNPTTLANDQAYVPRTYQDVDKINIGTTSYSSHVSVTTNSRLGVRAPTIMIGAGSLDKDEKSAVGIVNVDFTVHGHDATWADKNGNYRFDEGQESRNRYELAAAVNKRNASALLPEEEARAVVVADSDFLTDGLIRQPGNAYLLLDSLRWLGGEERFVGQVSNEEDLPITHTRKQDIAWFYLTVFAAPVAVLALGFGMSRKRRQRAKAKPAAGPPPPAADAGKEVSK